MSVEQSLLFDEAAKIAAEGPKPIAFTYEVTIHVDKKNIDALFVVERELVANFIENYCDNLNIEVAVPMGVLEYDLIPNKTLLEITVRKIALTEGIMAAKDNNGVIQTQRYKATLYDNKSGLVEGNNPLTATKEISERGMFENVRFQLLPVIIHQIRKTTVGNNYHDISGIELLVFLLTKHSQVTARDSDTSVKGVTVLGRPSKIKKEQIIIPHLTKLVDVGDYIHNNCGGLYSAGFKAYLQKQQWFVFAPYDLKAYDSSPKTLTIINIPANRLASTERTYRETPTQVILLVTGQVKHFDFSEQEQLNQGNGVRFVNADAVPAGFVTVENNKMFVNKARNVQEYLAENRAEGINNVVESPEAITSNPLVEMGRLARRTGSFIQAVWENANDNVIYPGMPVRYLYLQNNRAEELYGTLVGVQAHETATNVNVSNRRFISNTALTIFVQRAVKLTDAAT